MIINRMIFKKWLDNVTGRVSMYKLVLILLAIITVAALVLSLFGQLSYKPLTLLLLLVVSIASSAIPSVLLAPLFRTRAHPESAMITGFLIFFILPPSTALWIVALAGVIASLSKYVLAWRGRHIFNPAAVAAFIVTVTHLTFSGWWVATANLLPFVAVASFIVLYRTRRLTMGITFVVVAAVIDVIRFSAFQDVGASIQTVFVSISVVFFAGFMLSEPLTLPPRRWQQLVEAVIVGVLFSLPSIGQFSFSPQFALIVGNLLAFCFGQRRGLPLEFLAKKQLSASTWEFVFTPLRSVRFRAGQYMELSLPHSRADFRGTRRVFSISSAPAPDAPVTFAMTISDPPSTFKKALLNLAPGARIRGTGINGDFALPSDPAVPLLLVAGGIGITPFTSQLADATANGHARDTVVVYAVSDPGELAYADVLERSGVRVVLVAPTAPDVLPVNWEYAGPGRISREVLAASVPDAAKRRAYVSGPPALVNDVRVMLRSLGAKRVTSDYFSGY